MKNLTSIPEHSEYLEKTFKFEAVKWDMHMKRVRFGKKPLAVWQFVPCGEDGNVLEEPERWNDYLEFPESFDGNKEWYEFYAYEQAKERCLFEGFEIVKDKYKSCQREFIYLPNTKIQVWRKITFHTGEIQTFFFDYYEQFRTIEDLVKYNLQLTKTVEKQIGL